MADTAQLGKAQKGERVNGEVPYGYIADPNDRNHLLPDPETAHIVKQIFAMYVRGDRICEIQNWLREHEVLTVSELRYRRSGSCRHPPPTCISSCEKGGDNRKCCQDIEQFWQFHI